MLALMVMLVLLVWAIWCTWPPAGEPAPSHVRSSAGSVPRPVLAEVLVFGSASPEIARVRPTVRFVGRPVLDEDDLIAFGLALEAADDVVGELVDPAA
jgi:hypothetical protein